MSSIRAVAAHDPITPGATGPDGAAVAAAAAAADLGLLALAFGTAAGFTRLFDDWAFMGRLAVPLIAAWALALVLRRIGLQVLPSVLIHLGVGIVWLTVMFAPGTHLFGIPTAASIELLTESISASFSEFSRLIAPVAPSDGFLVVIAAGFWVFALFADTAAFRYAGPVQAAIPYVSTFLATGILARAHGRLTASVWFVCALVLYTATERMLRASQSRWVGGAGAHGSRAIGVTAALIGVCALIGGVALAPLLPGDAEPVVDLRDIGKGSGPRTVVSPFVGLRAMLGVRSDTEMFTVRSEQPTYWRLTALEEFDAARDIWVSQGSYRRTDGPLPSDLAPDVPGTPLRQDVRITGLSGLWLPGAYEPRDIAGDTAVSYDRESASIILRDERGSGEIDYRLESVVPDFAAAASARASTSDDVDPEYLEEEPLSAGTLQLLAEVTDGASDPFERAIALQNWFRSEFAYDETVDFRAASDPLAAFLIERRGFCQQFSSAFALMARAIGLPSRVAVGFTPGDPVRASDDSIEGAADVEYVVRGRHAHAWPEIHFEGIGWVPFEPTPGRGDPQNTEHTGVDAGQAAPPPQQAATTTSTVAPSQTPDDPASPSTTAPNELETVAPPTTEEPDDGTTPWVWLFVTVVVVGAATLGGLALRRSRPGRRSRTAVGGGRIGVAWQRASSSLAVLGLDPARSETPTEFAHRAAARLETDPHETDPPAPPDETDAPAPPDADAVLRGLQFLALAETARRYGVDEPSPEMCERAERAATEIEIYVRAVTSRRQRVEHALHR